MKIREDLLISFRSIVKRPVESFLLILGIALGIGAAGSGVSVVYSSLTESENLLNQPRYKEIIVSTKENTQGMTAPAEEFTSRERVVLTALDLVAKNEVPEVRFAYTNQNERLYFKDFFEKSAGTDDSKNPAIRNGRRQGDRQPEDKKQENNNEGNEKNEYTASKLPVPVIGELPVKLVTPEFFSAYKLYAAKGDMFSQKEVESQKPVLILGAEAAKRLYEDGKAFGRSIVTYRSGVLSITGILEPTGTDLDTMAFMPAVIPDPGMDSRMVGRKMQYFNANLHFSLGDPDDLDKAAAHLKSWFENRYGPNLVTISTPKEAAEAQADRNNRLVTIIFILALAGLLIAAVNVSNIIYSRFMKKRKTIGILKALGAGKQKILHLFFTEALIVNIGGTIIGTGIALFLAGLINSNLGISGFNVLILALGVAGSLIITLLFSIIPALQVIKIPASEAIRYE